MIFERRSGLWTMVLVMIGHGDWKDLGKQDCMKGRYGNTELKPSSSFGIVVRADLDSTTSIS
jgi:hypothetical protein